MNKIFICGSRKIPRLNKEVKKRLENIVEKGFVVLVGDANGVDKAVQRFLYERKYEKVFVYHSGEVPRNNIGSWECTKIGESSTKRDLKFYTAKDLAMVSEADYALCIWDGKSKGSLHNIGNLLISKKQVLLYLYPHRKFYILKTIGDLESLMSRLVLENTPSMARATEETLGKKVQKHYQSTFNIALER